MADRDEDFATRWSRRKSESQIEEADKTEAVGDDAPAEVAALTPETGEPVAPPPDLPSIESLTGDSDFSQFMQDGVPEELRRLALRKLWRLTPIIPDGLDDYDEDYSMIGMVVEKVSTLFKPGKGMQTAEEAERDAAEEAEREAAEKDGEVADEAAPEDEQAAGTEEHEAGDDADSSAETADADPGEDVADDPGKDVDDDMDDGEEAAEADEIENSDDEIA